MRDVLVIGMGTSGLVSALRCQEAGLSVTLLAKGIGSTHLAPGTIDVLGYDPDLVESPSEALPGFVQRNPDHPYALIGTDVVRHSLEWFAERFDGYRYAGSMDENLLLPTAIGSLKPSALAPETLAAGDLRNGGRLLFVGLRQLKDFYPSLAAQNVVNAKTPSGSDISARAVQIDLPTDGEADLSSLALARRFDDPDFLNAAADQISAHRDGEEAVGLPAVLGVERPREVWERLQDALGCSVFEIPGLPPSVPGFRLHEILLAQFEAAGGRLVVGAEAVGADTEGDRVTAVQVTAAARNKHFSASHFVLATGGFGSGAIELTSSWKVRENVFDLPVIGVPTEGQRFSPRYFDTQPISRAGIRVDDSLHPLDGAGRRLFANLTVVGACIAGSEAWREKSGEGISLSSGFKAASTAIEEAT
ncbi:MAG: glycerol-3-phosphate dehydrogenase subunit GlpB [Actinomycetota bacterium]